MELGRKAASGEVAGSLDARPPRAKSKYSMVRPQSFIRVVADCHHSDGRLSRFFLVNDVTSEVVIVPHTLPAAPSLEFRKSLCLRNSGFGSICPLCILCGAVGGPCLVHAGHLLLSTVG